ncbi:DUF2612 domain-containing protein [Shinella granuli]|uniref:Uncharacterized protein DUF2612 n=1 Tax=Shinella granuli TaxID=323621 RepID=A0A4R2CLU1_SHIGR|nr:DUF2612 domain-containing protein [Shinella granuli]TCN41435.1 uncharacterized protein DUF2612 [Shinella granuli]
MVCPDPALLVESKLDKIADEYRESPRLLGFIRDRLAEPAAVNELACSLLDYFDIDTAVGDQLTIIGKALGWPRCHCRGQRRPVFGFACEDECGPPVVPIGGFCEAEWDCGDGPDYIEFCFTDDELYRGFVKARRWAIAGDYTHQGITMAARDAFGPQATIGKEGNGVIEILTGRLLTNIEISIAHLYEQALPIPPGVRLDISHSNGPAFGFGTGWGGFCNGYWPVPIRLD